MSDINDREDKAGRRQLAEALVRDKGWGTSAKYRGKNLQWSKFLHAVSTFGKRAIQSAGLYDIHASQGQRP